MQEILSILSHPIIAGEVVIALLILVLGMILQGVKKREERGKRQKTFSLIIDSLIEKVYSFFEDILGEDTALWIKSYVLNLFIVIILANLLGLILDIIIYPFPGLGQYLQSPTGNVYFTGALAGVSMLIVLIVEAKSKGFGKFFYHYVPVLGRKLIKLDKKSLPKGIYYVIQPIVKLVDIVISLFMGILDIIGILAKVISLAFRLYGNMMAGSILIGMIVVMLGQAVKNWIGIEFPLLVPLIFYLQSMLTAIVQAFVFALLTSIFIKISGEEQDKKRKNADDSIQQKLAQSIQRTEI